MIPRSPSVADVFELARERLAERLHTGMPCKVTRYDAASRLADVQPLLRFTYRNEEGGLVEEAYPVVTNCPNMAAGGGPFRLMFDLAIDDVVWCAFAESSIDEWADQGGTVTPRDPRRHHLSDGVVLGLMRPAKAPFAGDASEGPNLAHDTSGVGVFWREAFVLLGTKDAAQFVALANLVVNELNSLRTALHLHTHPIPALPVATTGTAVAQTGFTSAGNTSAGPTIPAVGAVAATKVKAI